MERRDRLIKDMLYKIRILELKINYLLNENDDIFDSFDIIDDCSYDDFLEEYEELLDEEIDYYEDFE